MASAAAAGEEDLVTASPSLPRRPVGTAVSRRRQFRGAAVVYFRARTKTALSLSLSLSLMFPFDHRAMASLLAGSILSPKAMFAVAPARISWMVFIFSDAAPFHLGISKWPPRKRDAAGRGRGRSSLSFLF